MCGILAWLAPTTVPDPRRAVEATRLLAHRGPDDAGYLAWDGAGPPRPLGDVDTPSEVLSAPAAWCPRRRVEPDGSSGPARLLLGHRRLAIIDLTAAGHQPLSDPTGRRWIVFNGEIYNHVELRVELERAGRAFASSSDTEVVLAAWERWGPACLHRFVGMWAFVIVDLDARVAFAARDPFGIKPLHWSLLPDGALAFASELRALLHLRGGPAPVAPGPLLRYLARGVTDDGDETLLEGLRQLPPGTWASVSLDTPHPPRPRTYWAPEGGTPAGDGRLRRERFRALFLDSVRLHLRADVPVGAALSGGLDSSSIVAAMRALQGESLDLHAFHYAAEESAVDELRWAELAASAARARLHLARATPEDLVRDLDRLLLAQETPFGSTSIYAQYRVFQAANEAGVRVMLDGQGADELLAGYPGFRAAAAASRARRAGVAALLAPLVRPGPPLRTRLGLCARAVGRLLPARARRPLRRLLARGGPPPWLNLAWFSARGARLTDDDDPDPDPLRAEQLRTLCRTSLPMLLRFEDRNSMTHSVESRVPFLTRELAELCLSLPREDLVGDDGLGKVILREGLRGVTPAAILERRDKLGFATPERTWLVSLGPWVDRVLGGDVARSLPVWRHARVLADWQAVRAGTSAFDFRVWRWVCLVRWLELTGSFLPT